MQDQKTEITRLNSQIGFWETKLRTLEAKAAQTGADANAGLQQQMEELRAKKQEAQQTLDTIRDAEIESSIAGQPICCAPGDISGVCRIKDDSEL
jgi:prefoldin subunit 5